MVREIQNIHHKIISACDGPEAALQYIENNITNPDLRKIAIERAMASKGYQRALELCLEGEKADEKLPGLVKDWRILRYEVYEKQRNRAKQKELACLFVLEGDFSWYEKLKKLYTAPEWPVILQDLLPKLEKSPYKYRVYL